METKYYPIKYVARETGLTPLVIRAWERRYDAVVPKRTDTNRRLYSDEDVFRLKLLARAVDSGINIGAIAQKDNDRILEMIGPVSSKNDTSRPDGLSALATSKLNGDARQYLQAAIDSVQELDGQKLEEVLMRSSVQLSKHTVIEEIIVPLMHKIGDMWEEGEMRVINEHLATAVVRSFLGNMRGAFRLDSNAPGLLITTPQGQLHELGALLTAAAANEEGWRCTYLGPNVPSEEIIAAIDHTNPRALCLSIIHPADDPHMPHELEKIRTFLPTEFPIIVGGLAAHAYKKTLDQIGAEYLPDIRAFRRRLKELRTHK